MNQQISVTRLTINGLQENNSIFEIVYDQSEGSAQRDFIWRILCGARLRLRHSTLYPQHK